MALIALYIPLKRQPIAADLDAFWQPHWPQHFWAEQAGVADFNPLLEAFVVTAGGKIVVQYYKI